LADRRHAVVIGRVARIIGKESGVFAKACVAVLALGACGCTLLAIRQARLQAAHDLAKTQLAIQRADEELWKLRAAIAQRVNPTRVEEMADELADLHPLLAPTPAPANAAPGKVNPATQRQSMDAMARGDEREQ